MFLQVGEPLLHQGPAVLLGSRRQERGPGVGGLAEGRLVVDRGGVVDVDAVLLAVFTAVAQPEELSPERLAVDGVRAGQAVLDDHIKVPLVLLVDGLQVALLVCDLGVEDLNHRSQSLDLLVLG